MTYISYAIKKHNEEAEQLIKELGEMMPLIHWHIYPAEKDSDTLIFHISGSVIINGHKIGFACLIDKVRFSYQDRQERLAYLCHEVSGQLAKAIKNWKPD